MTGKGQSGTAAVLLLVWKLFIETKGKGLFQQCNQPVAFQPTSSIVRQSLRPQLTTLPCSVRGGLCSSILIEALLFTPFCSQHYYSTLLSSSTHHFFYQFLKKLGTHYSLRHSGVWFQVEQPLRTTEHSAVCMHCSAVLIRHFCVSQCKISEAKHRLLSAVPQYKICRIDSFNASDLFFLCCNAADIHSNVTFLKPLPGSPKH